MSKRRGGCGTLDRAGLAFAHCSSCHEDVDYGYDLVEVGLPNGDYLTVCCWVSSELGDADLAAVVAALDAEDSRVSTEGSEAA